VIGADLPLTGAQAGDATAALNQIQYVVHDVYGDRVEGLPVTLRVLDDSPGGSRDPGAAAHALHAALADPSLLGVVGPLDSDVAAAEIPVAGEAHLALVSPTAANACLTKPLPECDGLSQRLRPGGPPSFFRLVAPDDGEAAALVQFAISGLHAGRFAVGSDGQAYGTTLRARFEAALIAQGQSPAYAADLDPTSEAAVAAFLAAAKQAGADTILFGGRSGGGACRIAGGMAAALGSRAAFLGGGGILDGACESDAGPAATGVYSVGEGSPASSGLAARVLLEAIATAVKAQGGNLPTREQVRLAVGQTRLAGLDALGDPRIREYAIYQGRPPAPGQPPLNWDAVGSETL
jgi:branched-chain amino acid transport system substrate-binding protein